MTIAEMLVQEIGRSVAAGIIAAGGKVPEAEIPDSIRLAREIAREIVAAVYGEPCDVFSELEGDDETDSVAIVATPGETCADCGWPRSMHKEAKG